MLLLFLVLLLMMVGFSVLFPVEPYYVRRFGMDSWMMGLLVAGYSTMQFIFAPIWGALSDQVGRRPLLLLGLTGFVLTQLFFGLATARWMLFAARYGAGILSAATLPTAMAYIADITAPEERARGMGLIGAAFGLGVIVGPGIGGTLGQISLALPFFVSAGAGLLAAICVAVLLPESRPAASDRERTSHRRSRWAGYRRELGPLYLVTLVLSLGMAGVEMTFGFFAADRLELSPRGTAGIFVVLGVVAGLTQGLLVGRVTHRLGEFRTMLAGLAAGGLGMVAIGLSSSRISAGIGISLLALGMGLARPANSALISRQAGGQQGTVLGVMGSFDSLGRIGGPLLGGLLYRRGLSLPYFSGAALTLLALGLAAYWGSMAARQPNPVDARS